MNFSSPVILYGGSFDPFHDGHIHIASHATRDLPHVKQLIFVPAGLSPGKPPPLAPADLRLKWLQKAGYSTWDTELRRPGPSFTVDTLLEAHHLGGRKESLYFLLGSDAYANFSQWKNPEQIRSLCRLVVIGRPGAAMSQQNPEDILLNIPPHEASSTAIRAQIAQGKSPSHLPAWVLEDLTNLSLNSKNPYAIQK